MRKCKCPLDAVARLLGKKWVIVLLRDLFMGAEQFKDFLKANKNLSNKVLSQKLKEMESEGLIKKVLEQDIIKYKLTKEGKRLKPIIRSMVKYGKTYCSSDKNYETLITKLK